MLLQRDVLKRPSFTLSCMHMKRDVYRGVCIWKEVYAYEKKRAKETLFHDARPFELFKDVLMYTCEQIWGGGGVYAHGKRRIKEVYVSEKRCMYLKRNVCKWKEMYVSEKRCMYLKRDVCTWKEMYVNGKRRLKEVLIHDVRPLLMYENEKRRLKETYAYEKRCMHMKRDELKRCINTKRDVLQRCIHTKRDVCIWKDVRDV